MAFTFEQLVESILILMVFYLVYCLFFSKQASFATNRFILLAGIVSSIIFPFVEFNTLAPEQLNFYIKLKAIDVFANGSAAMEAGSYLLFSQLLSYIYWIGVICLLTRFLYQFIFMFRLIVLSKIEKKHKTRIVYTNKEHPVFSFLSYVFIDSKSQQCNGLGIILNHERVHIVQRHSIDLLLLELLAIVQWFNPVVWLYRKLVKQNHEFLADRGVIKAGVPDNIYQELLLGNYKSLKLGFANSFNHSLTFKRLIMMKKIKTNKYSTLRLLFIIPIMVTTVYFISCSKEQKNENNIGNSDSKVIKGAENQGDGKLLSPPPPPPPPIKYDDIAETKIEVMPEFPGGEPQLMNYLIKNVNYPKEAKEKGIQGKVFVRFMVNSTGKIANAEVIKSENPLLDKEALRVINSMPIWKPGLSKGKPVDVHYTIPIYFKLQ